MTRKVPMILAVFGFVLCGGAAHAASLAVTVTSIAETEGAIMLALFDSEAAYDGGEAVHAARIPVDDAEVSIAIDDLPPGRYAIKLYHDVNGNGVLDTNTLGLPIEGYGFSGEGGRFGPPAFDAAAFDIADDADNAVVVTLR